MKSFTPLLFITLFTSQSVFAAPAPIVSSTLETASREDHSFGIGGIISVAERPFVGVNKQSTSLPYLSYKYKGFYIEGLDVGLNVLNQNRFTLGLLATPRYYEVEAGFAKNGELEGIDKTNPTYFAGISTQYNMDIATLTLQVLADTDESSGTETVLSISKSFKPASSFSFSPSIGLTHQDAALVDHFYGVQSHEAKVDRPVYQGKASLNYHVSLNASFYITRYLELLGQIKYEKLGEGITDSPIVDKDTIGSATLGAVIRF
ncbi:MAG: MipA/OmpV family protein [Gammaproteobacteria bacterium]|nr:MipA/OmpV family protein [Gammaproteobacteria bacterium]